jgi:uncharacterized protein
MRLGLQWISCGKVLNGIGNENRAAAGALRAVDAPGCPQSADVMLLIPTRAGPSAIHGLGLFTDAPVAAGAPVWRFEPGFDQAFTPAQFDALPAPAREYLRHYAFRDGRDGAWVLSGDHSRFMNHDPRPNTGAPAGAGEPVTTVALRDIAAGEELTCDYFAFDAEAAAKLSGADGSA